MSGDVLLAIMAVGGALLAFVVYHSSRQQG